MAKLFTVHYIDFDGCESEALYTGANETDAFLAVANRFGAQPMIDYNAITSAVFDSISKIVTIGVDCGAIVIQCK